jgi:acyl dehydratase
MRIFQGTAELKLAEGENIGASDWIMIDQERINEFAKATGDYQWIHVDVERAAASPFGSTIAHGLLTLSLIPVIVGQIYRVEGIRHALNYGFGKVRFPAPVPVGSKVRGSVTLLSVTDVDGGVQVSGQVTIEREGSAKPVCVAESLSRFYL